MGKVFHLFIFQLLVGGHRCSSYFLTIVYRVAMTHICVILISYGFKLLYDFFCLGQIHSCSRHENCSRLSNKPPGRLGGDLASGHSCVLTRLIDVVRPTAKALGLGFRPNKKEKSGLSTSIHQVLPPDCRYHVTLSRLP